jgi:hypothetical protein
MGALAARSRSAMGTHRIQGPASRQTVVLGVQT